MMSRRGQTTPQMFHQNLRKIFQDGGQTSAQRALGVLAVSRGAGKMYFLGGLVPKSTVL